MRLRSIVRAAGFLSLGILLSTSAHAALFQHLDASVAGSLIDDGGVITWLDQSGNGRNATDTALGGIISEPSVGFPSGLSGVDFDASSSPARMQLLDPTDAALILDQSVGGAGGDDGYAMLLVVESLSGTDWNDLIGNTSAVGQVGHFVMRYGGSGGRLQAGVAGTIQNNTAGQTTGYQPDVPMVLGVNYNPTTQVATLASSLFNYSQDFGGRAPGDFTNSGSPLWLGSTNNAARFFDGQIGEVKIYDAALTAQEFADELAALDTKWTADPDGTLELIVDRATGTVTLSSPGAVDIDFVGLSIFSGSGSLNHVDWASISANYDTDSGDMSVDPDDEWLELSRDANDLSEVTLGTSTIAGGATIDLGTAFELGGVEDLTAEYADPINEEVVQVTVKYINDTPADLLAGDFNDDGVVDSLDFTVYRENLGQAVALPNETVSLGQVTEEDYATWAGNYGASDGGSVSVPEPTGLMLGLGSLVGLAIFSRRRAAPRGSALGVLAATALVGAATTADAARTVDRDYLLGEDGATAGITEAASAGIEVGSGAGNSAPGSTLDWVGPTGMNAIVILEAMGDTTGPVYSDVSSSGLDRPGASSGGLGATFDGTNYLISERGDPQTGGGLGSPQEALEPDGVDYGGLRTRGMQFWVYPTNDSAGARQDLVNDTYQFGVHITADNNWGMTWGAVDATTTTAEVVESTTAVEFDEWTHVMEYSTNSNVQGFIAGVLYVNGIATATRGFGSGESWQINTAGAIGADLDLVVGAALGGSDLTDPENPVALPETPNFEGTIDNLELFVAHGVDDAFGEFNLGSDNEFIAAAMAPYPDGDADLDGDVDDDDVAVFAANWLAVQDVDPRPEVIGIAGDLISRMTMADLNYDGRTDMNDWFILRDGHPEGDSLSLAAVLGGTVPEPTSGVLVLISAAAILSRRGVRARD